MPVKPYTQSTIAAVATPPGHGGIAIVRLSGPSSKEYLSRVFLPHSSLFTNFQPWKLHHGTILDKNGNTLDDCLAVFMPAPHSYTGEDIAEIHCHGNPIITQALLDHFFLLGAEPAKPGEYTKRAYLNQRLDLGQAEAVAEIIAAPSKDAVKISFDRLDGRLSAQLIELNEKIDEVRQLITASLDFTEEEMPIEISDILEILFQIKKRFNELLEYSRISSIYQNKAKVVLAGNTNAGKSSLLNALSGTRRALVTSTAGTTRDFIEQDINLGGLAITLVDTAGFRTTETSDPIERLGIIKSNEQIANADLLLLILDGEEWAKNDAWSPAAYMQELLDNHSDIPVIIVWNKCDLGELKPASACFRGNFLNCETSCVTGHNLACLKEMIIAQLLGGKITTQDNHVMPNARQALLLEKAQLGLMNLINALEKGIPLDCCASHLDEITGFLEEILGLSTNEEILNQIFSKFCIGK